MAVEIFEISEEPRFEKAIRKFQPTDPASAAVFNRVMQALVENGLYLKKAVDEQNTNLGIQRQDVPINMAVWASGDLVVVKSGNVATLLILGTLKTWAVNQLLGTIPVGFRPAIVTRSAVNQYSTTTNGVAAMVTLNTNGQITVAQMQNNFLYLVGSVTYICN